MKYGLCYVVSNGWVICGWWIRMWKEIVTAF